MLTDSLKGITDTVGVQIKQEFNKAFDEKVTPSFEQYLRQMFTQINHTLETGLQFFLQEQLGNSGKYQQIKDTLNDVVKLTRSLIDSVSVNQRNLFALDHLFQEKKEHFIQILAKIEQANTKQVTFAGRISKVGETFNTVTAVIEELSTVFEKSAKQFTTL